jgi:hypothetical protein
VKSHIRFTRGTSAKVGHNITDHNRRRASEIGKSGSEAPGKSGRSAARFTEHDTNKVFETHTSHHPGGPSEIHAPGETKAFGKGGKGSLARFNQHQTAASAHHIGHSGVQGAYIGSRGPSEEGGHFHTSKAKGTMTKSYKKESTSRGRGAGQASQPTAHRGTMESLRGRARTSWERA